MAENVWAWQCEYCHAWLTPESSPTAVILDEAGPEITTLWGVERLRIKRKMVICGDCVQTMRVAR